MDPRNTLSGQNTELQNAIALHQNGRLAEAATQYKKLLNLFPKNPYLLSEIGIIALKMGDSEEGVRLLEKSLEVEPNQPVTCVNLGIAFSQRKQLVKALANYDRAIALKPDYLLVHFKRGELLEKLNRPEEALASYGHVLAVEPGNFSAHFKRGELFEKLNRLDEVLASFPRVLAIKQDDFLVHFKRGVLLEKFKRYEEALASFSRAVAIKPDDALAQVNYGVLLQNSKRLDEALASYNRAITVKPDYAEAYWFKSLVKLLVGDYEEGWQLHEWRWRSEGYKNLCRNFNRPLWLGEQSIEGQTLLVHAEVGLGDSIQFCRYLPMVEAVGAKIILEMPAPLVSLISTLKGNYMVVEKGSPLPYFDLHCPAMSLPLAFKTSLESIPATVPYLFADPDKQRIWRKRLGNKEKPRVGLVWSGLIRGNIDLNPAKKRSVPLQLLEPLLRLPIEFHALQKDIRPDDADALAKFRHVYTHQDKIFDFSDTAALIKEMDLVISIDTSIAHLAGALGMPIWILLPFVTDYRWTLDGTATPWYPSATLFRQSEIGEWPNVISGIIQKLEAMFL